MLLRILYCLLLFTLLLPVSGIAQNSLTRLRLVHQSAPLPEGTVFVVLQRMSTEKVGDNWQPAFIAGDDFPVTSIEPIQVDTLADDQQSKASYLRTSATGHLYFLYALTPADDLYWSYSYERGQPKFDALEFGAMSVAPLTDAAIADVVRTRFFSDEPLDAPAPSDTLAAAPPPMLPDLSPATEESAAPPPAPPTADGRTPWWMWLLWLLLCAATVGLFYQQRRIGVLVDELQRLQSATPLPPVQAKAPPAAAEAMPSARPPERSTSNARPSINDAPALAASKAAADHAEDTLEATSQALHDQEAFAKTMRSEALSDFEAMRRNLEAIDQLADDLKRSSGTGDKR
ncbi:MAG: hypothetical protein AAGJ10_05090 [Bacteroidota bacterium]